MMNTPWGELQVCDAHVHFFSHSFFDALAKQKGNGETAESACFSIGLSVPPESPEALAKLWVDELDRHSVSRACMIASLPGDEDSVVRAVAAFPERFVGYFFLNPLAPDAMERLNSAFDNGLRGVCLFPAMHGYSVADERVRPVLEAAARQPGAIAFVHCGVLSVGVRRKLGLKSYFDIRYSNPVDIHPVALRFPQLPFVIPHFGAGYFREALMVSDLCPNVYLDTSSSNSWMKYMPSAVTLEEIFVRALDVAGPQRLLFGSDSSFFPRGWHSAVYQQQAEILERLNLPPAEVAGILGQNLLGLLNRPQTM